MYRVSSPLCLLSLGVLLGLGCGSDGTGSDAVPPDPIEQMMTQPGACLPDVTCAGVPAGKTPKEWEHFSSSLTVLAGSPNHRGIDLIATVDAPEQTLRGEISYGIIDKALEDEYVDLWACRAGAWQEVGVAITDGDGHFEYKLSGNNRLPVGRRQVFISVRGDHSSVLMLAVVLPSGGKAVISDVDGTLTTYENEYPESLVTGNQVIYRRGAAETERPSTDGRAGGVLQRSTAGT